MCRKSGIIKTIKYTITAFAVAACLFAGSVFPSVTGYAASSGRRHHEDTWDYCMQVSDVTITMSEIQSMSNGQREALVAGTSGYSLIYRNEDGNLSGRTADDYWTDFSGVSWSEGTYTVTVRLSAVRMDHDSWISYTLTVIDDLPDEPDPPVDPGEDPGEGGSGEDSGEDKTGEDSGEDKTGEDSGEDKTGEDSGEDKTGEDSGEDKTGEDSGEDKTGEDSGEDKTGEDSGEDKTGKTSSDGKSENMNNSSNGNTYKPSKPDKKPQKDDQGSSGDDSSSGSSRKNNGRSGSNRRNSSRRNSSSKPDSSSTAAGRSDSAETAETASTAETAAAAETAGTAETAAAMTEQTAETAVPAQESKDDTPVQEETTDGQNGQPAAEAEELSEEIAPAAAVITAAEGVTAVALLGVIISDARVLLWYRRKVKQVKEMMQHGEGGEE